MPSYGVLKFWNNSFGFITRTDNGEDVFIHVSVLRKAGIDPAVLVGGKTKLSFDLEKSAKGWQATDVALVA